MVGLLGIGAALRKGMAPLLYERVTWVNPGGSRTVCRCEVVAFTAMGSNAGRYQRDPVFSQGTGVMRVHPEDRWPEREATCDHPRLLKQVTLRELGPADRTGMREGSVTWS